MKIIKVTVILLLSTLDERDQTSPLQTIKMITLLKIFFFHNMKVPEESELNSFAVKPKTLSKDLGRLGVPVVTRGPRL